MPQCHRRLPLVSQFTVQLNGQRNRFDRAVAALVSGQKQCDRLGIHPRDITDLQRVPLHGEEATPLRSHAKARP